MACISASHIAFGEAAHKNILNLNVGQKIWNETDLNCQGELGYFFLNMAQRKVVSEVLVASQTPENKSWFFR
jgi:hypothetical protein